ncbi:hypothetical protein [Alteribacillus bidgolensis]|uniref:Uncharacterized protein n=1 Tax=Alteribacillus bidgolensis TaxID=930129 RepID=A0A1G8JKQ1_9BACI|nr:hypothetical protein [Alteribacillus bidgolensis]SDI31220.1 hypothetical protein SAMN05216352_106217 [Alteribacillus bidgolensis]
MGKYTKGQEALICGLGAGLAHLVVGFPVIYIFDTPDHIKTIVYSFGAGLGFILANEYIKKKEKETD